MTVLRITFLLLLLSGCTHIPQDPEEQIAAIVQERIGKEIVWDDSEELFTYTQTLLSQPLTSESAIQIALLNNPEVQALFEEMGIAQADLLEAGLLTNPTFELDVRYPHQKKLRTNIEYLVTASFLDIFLIPLRTKLSEAQFEQAKWRVAKAILDLAFEVGKTYYRLVGASQKLNLTQSIAELSHIQWEIASRQYRVGNISSLDLEQWQAKLVKSDLEITMAQEEILSLREKLHQLLGLREEICLILPPQLPEEWDDRDFDLCLLESIALQERMDLKVARFEMVRIGRMLGLKEGWVYTNLNTGVSGEREVSGTNVIGFGLQGAIPIFNYGQAARMRLVHSLRQAQDHFAALEIRVLAEVRAAYKILQNNMRMMQQYHTKMLPLQEQINRSSEALYNGMGLGIDRLLENKQRQIEVERQYREIQKEYWIARTHLDYVLGGYLH